MHLFERHCYKRTLGSDENSPVTIGVISKFCNDLSLWKITLILVSQFDFLYCYGLSNPIVKFTCQLQVLSPHHSIIPQVIRLTFHIRKQWSCYVSILMNRCEKDLFHKFVFMKIYKLQLYFHSSTHNIFTHKQWAFWCSASYFWYIRYYANIQLSLFLNILTSLCTPVS